MNGGGLPGVSTYEYKDEDGNVIGTSYYYGMSTASSFGVNRWLFFCPEWLYAPSDRSLTAFDVSRTRDYHIDWSSFPPKVVNNIAFHMSVGASTSTTLGYTVIEGIVKEDGKIVKTDDDILVKITKWDDKGNPTEYHEDVSEAEANGLKVRVSEDSPADTVIGIRADNGVYQLADGLTVKLDGNGIATINYEPPKEEVEEGADAGASQEEERHKFILRPETGEIEFENGDKILGSDGKFSGVTFTEQPFKYELICDIADGVKITQDINGNKQYSTSGYSVQEGTENGVAYRSILKNGTVQYKVYGDGRLMDYTVSGNGATSIVSVAGQSVNLNAISAAKGDVTVETASTLVDANGSGLNITAGGKFTLIGSNGTLGTAENPMEIKAESMNFKTSRGDAANKQGMDAYIDLAQGDKIAINDTVSTNGKTLIVSGDGSLTGTGTLNVDGGKLEAKSLVDMTLANLTATNGADVDLIADGIASSNSWSFTGSDVDISVRGNTTVNSLTVNGGTVDVNVSEGALELGTTASFTNGAQVNLTVPNGTITNTDNKSGNTIQSHANWTVDGATLNAITDKAVAIDHLNVSNGAAVLIDNAARTGVERYTGKTIAVTDGADKASVLTIHTVGDITLENDEDASAKGSVLDVKGSGKNATTVKLTSEAGGLLSATAHDGWSIRDAKVAIRVHDAPQVKDSVLIERADVSIVADYGDWTATDYTDGTAEKVEWTVNDSDLTVQVPGDLAVDHLVSSNSNVTVTALADADGKSVSRDNYLDAVGGGSLTSKDWKVSGGTLDVVVWGDILVTEEITASDGAQSTVRSRTGGMTLRDNTAADGESALTLTDGAKLTLELAEDALIDHINLTDATLNISAMNDNGDAKLAVSDRGEAFNGGGLVSKDWTLSGAELNADTWSHIEVSGAVNAANGSALTLNSKSGGLVNTGDASSWTLDDSTMTTQELSGGAVIDHLIAKNGSDLTVNTDGGVSSEDWSFTDSDVTLNAKGNIHTDEANLTGGTLTANTDGTLSADVWSSNGGTVVAQAKQNVEIDELTATNAADLSLSADDELTSDSWSFTDSAVALHAANELYATTATVSGGSLTATATDITLPDLTAENAANLSLTAENDIASENWTFTDSTVDMEAGNDVAATKATVSGGSFDAAAQNVMIHDLTAKDAAKATLTADGNVESGKWSISGDASVNATANDTLAVQTIESDGGSVDASAGTVNATNVTGANGASVKLVSLTDGVNIDQLELADTVAEIISKTDLNIGTGASITDGSDVKLESKTGQIVNRKLADDGKTPLGSLTATDSKLTLHAAQDVLVDSLTLDGTAEGTVISANENGETFAFTEEAWEKALNGGALIAVNLTV